MGSDREGKVSETFIIWMMSVYTSVDGSVPGGSLLLGTTRTSPCELCCPALRRCKQQSPNEERLQTQSVTSL